MAAERAVLGGVPPVVSPNVLYDRETAFPEVFPCTIWAHATIMAPWAIYQSSGDATILATQYHSMQLWMNATPRDIAKGRRLYEPTTLQLGDWLDPDAPPDHPEAAKTDCQLVANAFLLRSLDLISQILAILGKEQDAREYAKNGALVRREFSDEYISPNSLMISDSQTAYALGICFGLFPHPN